MNNYSHKLDLPVPLIHPVTPSDEGRAFYSRFDLKKDVNPEFIEWYEQLGLTWIIGGYFFTPANGRWPPHLDGKTLGDWCKINWRTGGPGTKVTWFEPLEGFELKHMDSMKESTTTNTNYSLIDRNMITPVYSTEHPECCMFNGGRIHEFYSGDTRQDIISIVLGNKDNKVLHWDEAYEVFKKFIIE